MPTFKRPRLNSNPVDLRGDLQKDFLTATPFDGFRHRIKDFE